MMRFLYTKLVGIPVSLFLMTIGCLLYLTVIGFPTGLVCLARGFKVLTIDSPRRTVVYVRRREACLSVRRGVGCVLTRPWGWAKLFVRVAHV